MSNDDRGAASDPPAAGPFGSRRDEMDWADAVAAEVAGGSPEGEATGGSGEGRDSAEASPGIAPAPEAPKDRPPWSAAEAAPPAALPFSAHPGGPGLPAPLPNGTVEARPELDEPPPAREPPVAAPAAAEPPIAAPAAAEPPIAAPAAEELPEAAPVFPAVLGAPGPSRRQGTGALAAPAAGRPPPPPPLSPPPAVFDQDIAPTPPSGAVALAPSPFARLASPPIAEPAVGPLPTEERDRPEPAAPEPAMAAPEPAMAAPEPAAMPVFAPVDPRPVGPPLLTADPSATLAAGATAPTATAPRPAARSGRAHSAARREVVRLGELPGRALDRRAININARRIGKLEPEWDFWHRVRSLIVLIVIVAIVAAAVAAVFSIAVEVLGAAANHAISKSAGS